VVWRSTADEVPDFAGPGDTEVVIRVQGGDGIADIAKTLADAGVVASPEAFQAQAAMDADVQALRPGYYRVRQHASAQAAADTLVAKENRVGHVRLIPGRQLADVTAVATDPTVAPTVVPGYISDITAAACVPLNGRHDCFTADQLWQVARTADPATLGVVEWAAETVAAAPDPSKRLEGMILPGDFDIPPGSTPEQALQAVISASAALWNGTDITADSARLGITAYQAAIIASLIEREAIVRDMPKVSRVIYNRLATSLNLELDSTINYTLDRASIATSPADRANPSPYNTYMQPGLPPTPISSPGPDAVAAALEPAEGSWLYFVKANQQGESCFSVTPEQHDACVAQARAAGVFG
ncbi:MAG TPA: endolytic transglycosylase MltG, partial [Nakamurella sp.]